MSSSASNSHRIFFGLVAFFFLVWISSLFSGNKGASDTAQLEPSQQYLGTWQDKPSRGLSSALAAHKATGCSEFYWRESTVTRGEFLVFCTRDGRQWTAYLVWPNIGKATGPLTPPADIDPPR